MPFVITVRKILSVILSIVWFDHSMSGMQFVGIFVVFLAAVFDFVYEKYFGEKKEVKGEVGTGKGEGEVSTISHVALEDTVDLEEMGSEREMEGYGGVAQISGKDFEGRGEGGERQ